MKNIIKLIIPIFLFIMTFSCSEKHKLNCFEKEQKKIKKEKMYLEIRELFKDTLDDWITKGLEPKRNLEEQIYKLDDALICDSERGKCILFLLMEEETGEIIYSTQFIGCECNGDSTWNFYYRAYPVTSYPFLKKEDDGFSYMSADTYNDLISDGLIKGCKIDDEYIGSEIWFPKDRKEQHKNFLKDIPYRNKY